MKGHCIIFLTYFQVISIFSLQIYIQYTSVYVAEWKQCEIHILSDTIVGHYVCLLSLYVLIRFYVVR